jgi:hypothetical protein
MQAFRIQKRDGAVPGSSLAQRPHRRIATLSMLSAGVILFGTAQHSVAVPPPKAAGPVVRKDIEIVSLTQLSGYVNGQAVEGRVTASFNTGRGGASTCQFSQLPDRFTPGTFSTHT